MFLAYGADPSFTFASTGYKAAITIAVEKKNREIVEMLVHKTTPKSDMPPYHGPKQQGCLIDNISYPVEFTPPLIRAVKIGNVELVRLLLAISRRRNGPKRRVFQDSHRPESRSHGEEIVPR
ncbi:hypothetical protein VSDG_06839 [Cytospora chrysosperma]|uniref:Uncharacterized protein n=1 Tax=Cytospora chrysosperma TaxID=252740 RepID=A0A423VQH4_CYTCH|nr:hypothetical protein VSDG_06839 [Valsa sordida]